ncbi:MAG: M36 family metallopeptidase [Saprospiraceae bacterium]
MIKKLTYLFCFSLFFVWSNTAEAQQQTPLDIALRHIETKTADWQLSPADVSDMVVNDQIVSKHNGVTHIYFMQRYQGVEIYNGIVNVNILPNGEVLHVGDNLVRNLTEKVNTTTTVLEPTRAVYNAAEHLGITGFANLELKSKSGAKHVYHGGDISNSDITVQKKYAPVFNSFGEITELRLTWDLAIDQKDNHDYYNLRMDAVTGELVSKNNYTTYCKLEHHRHAKGGQCTDDHAFTPVQEALLQQNQMLEESSSYNVFAVPNESPNHGEREVVISPADATASPFGWHDTDGMEGAEYTITRGNNVHAFLDAQGNNSPSEPEPDGGDELKFDFEFVELGEPDTNSQMAVTQLFYMNNVIHDFAYRYGFDEVSGNFQQNNYGNGGTGNDAVEANAQDGSGINNANFSTPPDGSEGRMQMFNWNRSGLLTVESPANLAGVYETSTADFTPSPNVSDEAFEPITGEVAIMDDGTADATQGCNPAIVDLTGKIAIVDRGSCFFIDKTFYAQEAGAIAAIICDFSGGGLGGMTAPADSPFQGQITIPTLGMSFGDCTAIRAAVGNPLVVTFGSPVQEGPMNLDGDFDNGIIAHEYGHGISIRLTGGRLNSGCLSNDEQMGEGWSDFFALAMHAKPGDVGEQRRGVGTYVQQQQTDGAGIRRFPYSNDMSVNPQTMNDIIGTTAPHPLGEVPATTLWDMYWLFVDEYGFDEDFINGEGGNNQAIQLVFDGMKFQGCNPGFIAGRDGILAADEANNGGRNSCLIWQAFAGRGFGFDADGRSKNNRNDGQEGYAMPPSCLDELVLNKTMTPVIEAGESIMTTIQATNYKAESMMVTISDELPAGTSYIMGSASVADVVVENGVITFPEVALGVDEAVTVTYEVSTPDNVASVRQFFDDVESGDANWEFEALDGNAIWDLNEDNSFSGTTSWFVPATAEGNDQVLRTLRPLAVTGTQPVLRFAHQFETEWATDGAIVEISRDNFQWERLTEDQIFRTPYNSQLAYGTFAIANLQCYAGNANPDWQMTYIDLSAYQGEQIWWRYRFGTEVEADGDPADGIGWYIDDIEVFDMANYNSMATATSSGGDVVTAMAAERGTVVEGNMATNTEDLAAESVAVSVYPNPAGDLLNVAITNDDNTAITITIVNVDGKEVLTQQMDTYRGQEIVPFNVASLAAGMYFVKVSTTDATVVRKVMID